MIKSANYIYNMRLILNKLTFLKCMPTVIPVIDHNTFNFIYFFPSCFVEKKKKSFKVQQVLFLLQKLLYRFLTRILQYIHLKIHTRSLQLPQVKIMKQNPSKDQQNKHQVKCKSKLSYSLKKKNKGIFMKMLVFEEML